MVSFLFNLSFHILILIHILLWSVVKVNEWTLVSITFEPYILGHHTIHVYSFSVNSHLQSVKFFVSQGEVRPIKPYASGNEQDKGNNINVSVPSYLKKN